MKNTLLKFEIPESILLEQNGIISVDVDETVNISWSETALIVIGKNSRFDEENLKALAIQQLNQPAQESINTIKGFGEFLSNKKDISVFYSIDNFFPLFESNFSDASLAFNAPVVAMYKEMFSKFSALSVGGFVSFEKGEIVMTQKPFFENSEVKKQYESLYNNMCGTINGAHLGYIADKPLMSFCMNLKGEGIYNYINELGLLKDYEEDIDANLMMMDTNLKEFISNLEGDFSYAIHTMPSGQGFLDIPNFSVFIDTKDIDKIWPMLKSSLEGMGTEIKEDNYVIEIGSDINIYLGAKGKTVFVTTMKDVYDNLDASKSVGTLRGKAKGEVMFMSGNLESLTPYILKEMRYASAIEKDFVSKGLALIGDIEATDNKNGGKCTIEITKKNKNSLAVITQYISDAVSALMR